MATSLEVDAPTRAALVSHLDDVLGAMVGCDPSRAQLGRNARYTENGQPLAIGDGAWGTATALGPYRHDIVDHESSQIATFTTLTEGKTRSILVARLRVEGEAVVEIEAFVARPDLMTRGGPFAEGAAWLDASDGPDLRWAAEIPPAERLDRAELRRIADLYFAGLEKNDGKGDYPFADDCIRIENGLRTTGSPESATGAAPTEGEARAEGSPYTPNFMVMSVREQFETGYFRFVDRIRHRRFPVIDVERGLVFAFAFFDHSGTVRDYPLADGRIVTSGVDRPFTWEIGEAFKIERGQITRIEAVMTPCPYGMPPGWPMLPGDIG